jgi:hypothetical protein
MGKIERFTVLKDVVDTAIIALKCYSFLCYKWDSFPEKWIWNISVVPNKVSEENASQVSFSVNSYNL